MQRIYDLTRDYVKGRWFSIFAVSFIFSIITGVLTMLISGRDIYNLFNNFYNTLVYYDYDGMEYASEVFTNSISSTSGLIILINILKEVLQNGFDIEIRRSYSSYKEINLESVFEKIKENFWRLSLFSILKIALNSIISIAMVFVIIIIGLVVMAAVVNSTSILALTLSIIFVFAVIIGVMFIILNIEIGFSYTQYILDEDKEIDIWEAMKLSYSQTKGHKFNLFRAQIHYVLISILFFLGIMAINVVIVISGSEILGTVFMLLSFLVFTALLIYFTPRMSVIRAIYHVETDPNSHSNQKIDLEQTGSVLE